MARRSTGFRARRTRPAAIPGGVAGRRVALNARDRWTREVRSCGRVVVRRILPGAIERMAIEVETKDCTALSDAELAEMADICVDGPSRFEVGLLSKQTEAWVLVTLAREGRSLKAFSFSTLERIGGTPAVLIGLASVRRTSKRDSVMRAIMAEQYRRAVLAFPDEDVLVGTRIINAGGFEALRALDDIVPRPDHRASGEERAWGRRLAKRFGVETGNYNDRDFTAVGDGAFPLVLDHDTLKPENLDVDVVAIFDKTNAKRGDSVIVFGWAMAERLAKLG